MEPTTKSTAKDFFMYLGIIATLYTSVGSLLALLFNYINYAFPDALTDQSYYYDPYTSAVRFSLAMLIVLFPVFLGLSYYQNKELQLDPSRKDVGVRKWLLFLTLFLASVLVIGDLITLINTFLNGEVTSRFMYKVLAVLVVAGLTLYYYMLDLRGTYIVKPKLGHSFGLVSIVIVLGSIIGGFLITGSPQNARLIGFDRQKVSDLMNIQSQVLNYWQTKAKLPSTLAETKDSLGYGVIPTDAQTGQPYEYNVKGTYSFELCATFNKDIDLRKYPNSGKGGSIGMPMPTDYTTPYMPEGASNWQYKAGRTCFTRTIDPEIYKPYPKAL